MEHVRDVFEQLKNVEVPVKCRRCGAMPYLVGYETRIRCPSCGMMIEVSRERLVILKQKENTLKNGEYINLRRCSICCDTGVVVLEKQVDGVISEYGYRCICQEGVKRQDISAWPILPPEEARLNVRLNVRSV